MFFYILFVAISNLCLGYFLAWLFLADREPKAARAMVSGDQPMASATAAAATEVTSVGDATERASSDDLPDRVAATARDAIASDGPVDEKSEESPPDGSAAEDPGPRASAKAGLGTDTAEADAPDADTAEADAPDADAPEAGAPENAAPPPAGSPQPKSWADFGEQLQKLRDRLESARSAGDKQRVKEVAAQLQACTQSWCSQLQQWLQTDDAETQVELFAGGGDREQLEKCLAQFETRLANLKSLDWNEEVDSIVERLESEAAALDQHRPPAEAAT